MRYYCVSECVLLVHTAERALLNAAERALLGALSCRLACCGYLGGDGAGNLLPSYLFCVALLGASVACAELLQTTADPNCGVGCIVGRIVACVCIKHCSWHFCAAAFCKVLCVAAFAASRVCKAARLCALRRGGSCAFSVVLLA